MKNKLRKKKAPGRPRPKGRPRVKDSGSDARRRRDLALAELRELEVAEKKGRLLKLADVVRERAELGRQVRDAILNVPDRTCYQLAAETDAKKHRRLHYAALCEALEVLGNANLANS